MKTTKEGLQQQELNLRSMKLSKKAIMKWLLITRRENVPINGPTFKKKAQEFDEQLNLEDFHASDGWLEKLKKRYVYIALQ